MRYSVDDYLIWREEVEKIVKEHIDFLNWKVIPFPWLEHYTAKHSPHITAEALICHVRQFIQRFLDLDVR